LNKAVSVTTLAHHKDKVQSVKWHPLEAGILMSAGYDKSVRVTDQRANSALSSAVVNLEFDPECTIWSRHSPSLILISDEKGFISAHDLRKINAGPVWSVKAHGKGGCTSFTDVMNQPDLMISAGLDGEAKIWKSDKCLLEPQLVFSRDLGAGALFSVSSHNDDASLAVFGASCPVLWNITDSDVVCKTFPSLPGADRPAVQFPDEEEDNLEELDDD
jgi:periodic tryptophan protein 1